MYNLSFGNMQDPFGLLVVKYTINSKFFESGINFFVIKKSTPEPENSELISSDYEYLPI